MLIRQLTIERFRCVEWMQVRPGPRVVLLGPNNAGKSTVLEALDLLLHPGFGRPRPAPTEVDYFRRATGQGFLIEAIVGDLRPDFRAQVAGHLEGWRATDHTLLPEPDGDGVETVVRLRVRGTSDFDLIHEFAKDESEGARVGRTLRSQLGWVFDGRSRDPLRELAFYQGGLLDKLFSEMDLDPAVAELRDVLAKGAAAINSQPAIAAVLNGLADDLRQLGLIRSAERPEFEAGSVSQRELLQSLRLALLLDEVRVPLQRQGRGSQRLLLIAVLLRIARARGTPIIGGFEEPEEALEPLRQAQVAEMLIELSRQGGQLFVVTHSAETARMFELDDFVLLGERRHGRDARELRTAVTGVARRTFERRVDGPVVRGLFAKVPLLVEGPSDRGAIEVFWRTLAKQGQIPSQAELGVDIVNCEGSSNIPAMAALLHQAGKPVAVWAERDTKEVEADLARMEAEKTVAMFVLAEGDPDQRNLEGALTARCSIPALAAAMGAMAADRQIDWQQQREDLVSRWKGSAELRERLKVAPTLGDLLAILAPQDARSLAANALASQKRTPFEIKGARQGRLFAEALAAAEDVPSNFAATLKGLAAAVTQNQAARLLLSCVPAADAAAT